MTPAASHAMAAPADATVADNPAPAGHQPATGPDVRWRQVYPGEEAQIAALRRWLAVLLPACDTRDDVVTVAAELATNAVRHTASGHYGWFTVDVIWNPGTVQITVADEGAPSGPRMDDDIDPLSESGHGLQVVRALSVSIGVAGDERGRSVSADVAWPGAGPRGAGGPGLPAGSRHQAG